MIHIFLKCDFWVLFGTSLWSHDKPWAFHVPPSSPWEPIIPCYTSAHHSVPVTQAEQGSFQKKHLLFGSSSLRAVSEGTSADAFLHPPSKLWQECGMTPFSFLHDRAASFCFFFLLCVLGSGLWKQWHSAGVSGTEEEVLVEGEKWWWEEWHASPENFPEWRAPPPLLPPPPPPPR